MSRKLWLHAILTALLALACTISVQAKSLHAQASDNGTGISGYYTTSVPDSATLLPNRSLNQQLDAMRKSHLDAIEGIWNYPDEMMTVAVERFTAPDFASRIAYRIVMLESEDFTLYPGTVIGYLAPSADSSKFELWLYSERRGSMLYSPVRMIATLTGSMLTFKRTIEMKLKVRVNFARFLPSLFRGISITPDATTESLPVGFSRIWPNATGISGYGSKIRYL
ncbi:MAG: hypothetical protein ACI4UN_06505 [Muribaculaceae bacterium]